MTPTRILTLAAIVEIGTGLAVIVMPGVVVAWLLGAEIAGVGAPLARCFGIALIALGLACWPSAQGGLDSPALRAMLFYNPLIALFLAYLGTAGQLAGPLLWPAVGLHGVLTLLLVRAWSAGRRSVSDGASPKIER